MRVATNSVCVAFVCVSVTPDRHHELACLASGVNFCHTSRLHVTSWCCQRTFGASKASSWSTRTLRSPRFSPQRLKSIHDLTLRTLQACKCYTQSRTSLPCSQQKYHSAMPKDCMYFHTFICRRPLMLYIQRKFFK